jgi:hypothetical protein
LWKDLEITDDDFTDAKRAVFKDANNWNDWKLDGYLFE